MFRGLLNRVKFDLVRRYLKCDVWNPVNRQQRPMGETSQVSARL